MHNKETTVLSALPRATLEAARAVDMNATSIMAEARIHPEVLGDPDRRVPIGSYASLLRICERDPRSRALVAHKLQCRDVAPFGVVGYIIRNASTIAEGFSAYERHRRVISELCRFHASSTDTTFSLHLAFLPPLSELRFFNDGIAAMTHALVCTLFGEPVRLKRIEFPYRRYRGSAWIEDLLDAPAMYGTESAVLRYPSKVGRASIPGADPILLLFLERHAKALAARIAEPLTWHVRTREIVMTRLRRGKPASFEIARDLAVSPRTLQRRLAEEDTTFARVLDAARHELALTYVKDRDSSLTEIAFSLGYADLSGFHRAFQRWTGQSPAKYRRVRR